MLSYPYKISVARLTELLISMFEAESEGNEDPKVQVQLHDITERMSLLLTSYEGPSDKLSQRLALKREKENDKMKGALFGVLQDFNQIVDERDNLLASIRDWFDGSSQLMRGIDSEGNAEEVWEMIENEMKKLFGVLQTFKNSSKDVSELERRLLKVVFKDTDIGDLEKVRNKIQFNSFRKKAKFSMTPQIEQESSLETIEEIPTEFNGDSITNEVTTNGVCPVALCSVEIQADLLSESQINCQDITIAKQPISSSSPLRINAASQTENMDLEQNISNGSFVVESLPNEFNVSVSYLEVTISEPVAESNGILQSNNTEYSDKDSSNNEINIPSFKHKNKFLSNSQQKTSTPGKRTNTSQHIPNLHAKNSPRLSPVLSPIYTTSNRSELSVHKSRNLPNLSFMQKEQIKHDSIELYMEKSRGKSANANRLLTPVSSYSPKKNATMRILGNIRTDSAQPTHIFKQDDDTLKWGSQLVDFMKDMCIK